jgi:hypothetical protein
MNLVLLKASMQAQCPDYVSSSKRIRLHVVANVSHDRAAVVRRPRLGAAWSHIVWNYLTYHARRFSFVENTLPEALIGGINLNECG